MPRRLGDYLIALRYVLRECGQEQGFYFRPQVGEILTLTPSITNIPTQAILLMITRANQRAPPIVEDFLLCLEKLIAWLEDRGISSFLVPTLDPERPVHSLANLYQLMMDLFVGTQIGVYGLILGIEVGNELP